jgi:hypothetical protein
MRLALKAIPRTCVANIRKKKKKKYRLCKNEVLSIVESKACLDESREGCENYVMRTIL